MLDKYQSVEDTRVLPQRPNPEVWSSRQTQQDRYEEMVSLIRPLHEEVASIYENDMEEESWEGFKEYQDEREALMSEMFDTQEETLPYLHGCE